MTATRDVVLPADWREREATAYKTLRRGIADADGLTLIDEPARFVERDGTVRGLYCPPPPHLETLIGEVVDVLPTVPLTLSSASYRSDGMQQRGSIFGYRPRSTLMSHDFCGSCRFNRMAPEATDLFKRAAEGIVDVYRDTAPDVYANHIGRVAEQIDERWQYAGPYTAGILNWNATLPYHRDSGNLGGTWNIMLTARGGGTVDGGVMAIPGWGVSLACDSGWVSLFDAGALMHGVTPIRKRNRDAWRASIVWYTLKAMHKCGSPEEEKRHAQRVRTEREERRAAGLMPNE